MYSDKQTLRATIERLKEQLRGLEARIENPSDTVNANIVAGWRAEYRNIAQVVEEYEGKLSRL